jgi:lipoyl(octanoyl) transferase
MAADPAGAPRPGGVPGDAGLAWEWLGRVGYLDALGRQRARRDAILAGRADEVLWLLEHDPVVTTGRRAVDLDPARIPWPIVATERGGLATFHGPGQLVGYLLADVGRRGLGVRRTVTALEGGVIAWLAGQRITAARRPDAPGVWVGRDKVCAVGLHFRRGVSMHGFALNLDVALASYAGFVPCGIADGGVTSVERLLGRSPSTIEAAPSVAAAVVRALVDTPTSRS